jgi:diguanylate cyclase (GGDEF)-like protein/PAS domain S-box-containing protein
MLTLVAGALLARQQNIALATVMLLPAVFLLIVPTYFRATVAVGAAASVAMLAGQTLATGFTSTIPKLAIALVLMNLVLAVLRSRSGRTLRMAWANGESYKRALAALAHSRRLLERTFSAVPVPLLVTELGTGKVISANEAASRFFRIGQSELLDYKASDFYVSPRDRARFVRDLGKNTLIRDYHASLHRADGEQRHVALSANKVEDPAGQASLLVTSIVDLTDQERREKELRAAEAEYRALFENTVVGVYRSTPDGRMLRANPALVRLNGYETEDELVSAVNDIASEWYVEPGRRDEWMRLMYGEGRVIDFVSEIYRHKTRERIWISENSWTVKGPNGETWFEGTLVESTERMEAENRNQYLAHYDELTDLPNRRLLMERLEESVSWVKRHSGRIAVMCLDLDRFKAVNDAFGHVAGDLLLQEAARRLKMACRGEDVVARVGGDEFTILCRGIDGSSTATVLAERIIRMFGDPFEIGGPRALVGTSIGIAIAPEDGIKPGELIEKADRALYAAKAAGRNCYRFHETELELEAAREAV